jgi:hypothetical protein
MLGGFINEGKALSQMPVGLDPATRAAVQEGTSALEFVPLVSRMRRQLTLALNLGKANLLEDLNVILASNPDLIVRIIEAGASKVTKPAETQTKKLLANLEHYLDQTGKPHGHVEYVLLSGETHAVDANPGRAAYLIQQGLSARPKVNRPV